MKSRLLITKEEFEKTARNSLRRNLASELGNTLNEDPYIIWLLTERYLNLYTLDELPDRRFVSSIWEANNYEIFKQEISKNRDYTPMTRFFQAAQAIEFYGGLFFDYVNSRRHAFNFRDFASLLENAYGSIAYYCPQRTYRILSNKGEEVLKAFRETTSELSKGREKIHLILDF